MRRQRSIRATVALALLLLLASAIGPLAAGANSLLSGYGGPGQGNQAILGAALVGGRSTGGGSTGGGSGNADSGGEPSLSLRSGAHEAGTSDPSAARVGARGSRAAGASVTARRHSDGASADGSSTYPGRSGASTPPTGSGSSSALGLSGTDALYILLALGVLILTAVLTRRLARQPG